MFLIYSIALVFYRAACRVHTWWEDIKEPFDIGE